MLLIIQHDQTITHSGETTGFDQNVGQGKSVIDDSGF